MKLNTTIINQTVAILCDGNNIERSIQDEANRNVMVNFDTLIPRLLNGRGLNRFIYFREGVHISDKLAERLYTKFYGSVVPCHKSADIPLSIKATQLASKVDTIIIMSGDSDYVELVRHLKSEGVRVEIAAVKKTSAKILLDEADYYHPITQQDWFSYNKPGTNGRSNNYSSQSNRGNTVTKQASNKKQVSEQEQQTKETTQSSHKAVSQNSAKPAKKSVAKTAVEKLKSITKVVSKSKDKPAPKKKASIVKKPTHTKKKTATKKTDSKTVTKERRTTRKK